MYFTRSVRVIITSSTWYLTDEPDFRVLLCYLAIVRDIRGHNTFHGLQLLERISFKRVSKIAYALVRENEQKYNVSHTDTFMLYDIM